VRAARLDERGVLTVADLPAPVPEPDQVVVEIAACGICGTDIHLRRSGLVGEGAVMGHECSGTVVELGEEVSGWALGDRVAVMPYQPCGTCAQCLRGKPQLCGEQFRTGIGLGPRPGALAERVAVWTGQLHALPEQVPTVAGALAEPLAVGMHGVDRSGIAPGGHAVVMGGGSIGVMTAYALRARGVDDVVVSEPSSYRRSMLGELGFTAVAPNQVGRHADDPEVVFDTTGVGTAFADATWLVRPGGTVVLLGVVEQTTEVVPAHWLLREIEIRTALAYGDSFPEAVEALGQGRIDIDALSASTMSLEDAEEAFRLLASTEAPPKILIVP
jgi:threonine dehydrogenase-like Zn-dependent dehydrogenase